MKRLGMRFIEPWHKGQRRGLLTRGGSVVDSVVMAASCEILMMAI